MDAGDPIGDIAEGSATAEPITSLQTDTEPSAPEALNLASPASNIPSGPEGIGGWLVLTMIGLIYSPLRLFSAALSDFHSLNAPNHVLANIRLPGLTVLVTFELFANVTLLLVTASLVFFFFRQDRRFPRLAQLWLLLSLAEKLAELTLSFRVSVSPDWEKGEQLMAKMHASLALTVVEALVSAVVWIWYFEVSRRVKATFIR